jgi:ribonuclease R
MDRYIAAYMADKVGEIFAARISGVTRFGLFVTLAVSGASGLLPMRALPDDYWMLDEAAHTLTGRRSGFAYAIGDALPVRLTEANPLTGGLLFGVAEQGPAARPKRGRRPR